MCWLLRLAGSPENRLLDWLGGRLQGEQIVDPIMMTLTEARRRDGILRAYIEGRDWELDGEQMLVRHLVCNSGKLLPDWPLLVGYEWGPPGGTRGDLLFFDGEASFAVVEVKSLAKTPNKKRNQVEKQAREAAERVSTPRRDAFVTPLVYTDDERQADVGPRDPDARTRF